MNKKILAMACALTAGTLSAEWQTVGAKGFGMGGAQVAIPEGSQAVLVNPAALSRESRSDISIPVGVYVGAEGTVIEQVEGLESTFSNTIDPALDQIGQGGSNNASSLSTVSNFFTKTLKDALDKPGQGIEANANAALTGRWGRFGIAVGGRVLGGGTITYDSNFGFTTTGGSFFDSAEAADVKSEASNATLVSRTNSSNDAQEIFNNSNAGTNGLTQTEVEYYVQQVTGSEDRPLTTEEKNLLTSLATDVNGSLNGTTTQNTDPNVAIDNDTGITIRGLVTREATLAYGFSFMDKKLHVAPALKIISGETFTSKITIADTTDDNKDIGDELEEDSNNTVKSTEFTLDVGVLYELSDKWSLGLSLKDITSPGFELSGGGEIELEPSARLGTAYQYSQKPGWRGVLAADFDLLETANPVILGSDNREIALGLSQEMMGFLSLRLGASKNLGGESDGLSYAAGIGLQLYKFYLDISGGMSSDEVTVDGDDFPTKGGVGITLGWNMNF